MKLVVLIAIIIASIFIAIGYLSHAELQDTRDYYNHKYKDEIRVLRSELRRSKDTENSLSARLDSVHLVNDSLVNRLKHNKLN